jgi:hypothetical protein
MTAPRKGKAKKTNSKPKTASSARASLKRYREKRDFARTSEPKPEPKPKREAGGPLRFVVQKHAARRVHYEKLGRNARPEPHGRGQAARGPHRGSPD